MGNDAFEVGLVTTRKMNLFECYMTTDVVEDIYAEEPYVVIGLSVDGKACGVIAGCLVEEEVFSVMNFYVDPQVRRQGGGTLLLDTLLEQIFENNENTAVRLFFTEDSDDTEALCEFMLARGESESIENTEDDFPEHRFVIVK